jgi:SLT domain-containing protein
VAQWRGDVFRALSMLNLPSGDVLDVLYQMMTESGGNPNIVNRTDSNWLAGHPSVGLMQVIRGTFDTWAGPYRNTGPFSYGVSVNPMANIYAALNYAKHGRGFGTGPGQIGSGHGYDKGGWLMPGSTLAVNNTGRPERVSAPGEPVVVKMIFASSGSADFDRFMMTWIKRSVSVSGGGSVQAAFGSGT